MPFWKRKASDKGNSEYQLEAYRLTSYGYERLRRSDNPTLSYDGAMILSLLKDGRQTIGDIATRCGYAIGSRVQSELKELVSLGLIVKDDVSIRTEKFNW